VSDSIRGIPVAEDHRGLYAGLDEPLTKGDQVQPVDELADAEESAEPTTEEGYARENWWGRHDDNRGHEGGHVEINGTEPAKWLAHSYLMPLTVSVCEKTGLRLSEPDFHLPKQIEVATDRYLEYRQHRHRRRYTPETGDIPWLDRYGRAAGFRVANCPASPDTWYLTDGSKGEGAIEPGQWFLTGDDVAEAGSFKAAVGQRRGDAVPSDLCLESVDISGVRELELLSQEDS